MDRLIDAVSNESQTHGGQRPAAVEEADQFDKRFSRAERFGRIVLQRRARQEYPEHDDHSGTRDDAKAGDVDERRPHTDRQLVGIDRLVRFLPHCLDDFPDPVADDDQASQGDEPIPEWQIHDSRNPEARLPGRVTAARRPQPARETEGFQADRAVSQRPNEIADAHHQPAECRAVTIRIEQPIEHAPECIAAQADRHHPQECVTQRLREQDPQRAARIRNPAAAVEGCRYGKGADDGVDEGLGRVAEAGERFDHQRSALLKNRS